ncbi:MAG: hypothetical protein J6V44_09510 [Methanobrevibacter sp.]|nr:hypothetical protein [Methanobrevibacter sp.]
MSVTYNTDGYPIYSGGNGGYAENIKVDDAISNILNEIESITGSFNTTIEDLDLAKQNKLKYIHCSFSENYESNTITVTPGNYSGILEFDDYVTNDNNYETFDLADGELLINKSGLYFLNASIYFGMTTTISEGIYVYNNDSEIMSNVFYGATTSAGGKTIGGKLIYLSEGDIITVKGRNNMTSGSSQATIYTKNTMTYLEAILIEGVEDEGGEPSGPV